MTTATTTCWAAATRTWARVLQLAAPPVTLPLGTPRLAATRPVPVLTVGDVDLGNGMLSEEALEIPTGSKTQQMHGNFATNEA